MGKKRINMAMNITQPLTSSQLIAWISKKKDTYGTGRNQKAMWKLVSNVARAATGSSLQLVHIIHSTNNGKWDCSSRIVHLWSEMGLQETLDSSHLPKHHCWEESWTQWSFRTSCVQLSGSRFCEGSTSICPSQILCWLDSNGIVVHSLETRVFRVLEF